MMITENESTQEQKIKARQAARKLKSPSICSLCGRRKTDLVRHHWHGYEPPHETDVWFICKHANSIIAEHDGTPIKYIRKRYPIDFVDQPLLFLDDTCGMEKELNARRYKYCVWFVRWSLKLGKKLKDYFPKSFHKQKVWFFNHIEWFFNNKEERRGLLEKIKAQQVMEGMTEEQVWDLGMSQQDKKKEIQDERKW